MRTAIYIDGFNFYYLAVKNTPYKWLDFKEVFTKLLHAENKIVSIKYFTAIVDGKRDPHKPIRQETYIRALKKHIPEFKVYYGQFKSHVVSMPLSRTTKSRKSVRNDAWANDYDRAIIVSHDSDLLGAIQIVKYQLKKQIGVIILPKGHPSADLIKTADFTVHLRNTLLSSSQLPSPIPRTKITKPKTW
jgi:hypothetical protein